jgi:hypothetical protein
LLVVLLMMAILTGVRWNLSVVLIRISFIARDGEHFFMCFLAISNDTILNVCVPNTGVFKNWSKNVYTNWEKIKITAEDFNTPLFTSDKKNKDME